ncbi:MAG TPA: hypothetical protein VLX92_04275 [Kofleriaceae bacterium]|nr:hypothetical protein [Kofleriaceae bacterium]
MRNTNTPIPTIALDALITVTGGCGHGCRCRGCGGGGGGGGGGGLGAEVTVATGAPAAQLINGAAQPNVQTVNA